MLRAIILLLAMFSSLFSDNTGSLIVSYRTDSKGERLERVRFRVTGEKGYSELYPKGGAVVNNDPSPCCVVAVDDLPEGPYALEFIVPNQDALFEEVPPRKIQIEAEAVTKVDQFIRPRDTEAKLIAAKEDTPIPKKGYPLVKIDENNSIGTYEVTNKQYARWLNKATVLKQIYIVDDPSKKGWILDEQGRLLFKCREADATSQISLSPSQYFEVVSGKEHFPVIQVTWYGAMAFCKDHGFRLPSEAEWVHAAAHSREQTNRIYVYGFSRDQISPLWANYKWDSKPLATLDVLTTKVGFYNGKNQLPMGLTMNATSPFGAYDMSGNVWEWVDDPSQNGTRLAKGGCYDSTADGVRVTEKIALPPDHCDQFTGFRVYKSRL